MAKKVLIPIPEYEYDPSEVAIPWQILHNAGHIITFATPRGKNKGPDPIMLKGSTLGPLKKILAADQIAITAYNELKAEKSFKQPIKYSEINPEDYDLLVLPGGHAPGVKEYLESKEIRKIAEHFFETKKIIGAICHGVLIAARCKNRKTKKYYLNDYKVTCLLRAQEISAWLLTCIWLGNYYRTYPGDTTEAEVKRSLSSKKNFIKGPTPIFRDSLSKLEVGFVCEDRNFISARWPGDCHNFALALCKKLES